MMKIRKSRKPERKEESLPTVHHYDTRRTFYTMHSLKQLLVDNQNFIYTNPAAEGNTKISQICFA